MSARPRPGPGSAVLLALLALAGSELLRPAPAPPPRPGRAALASLPAAQLLLAARTPTGRYRAQALGAEVLLELDEGGAVRSLELRRGPLALRAGPAEARTGAVPGARTALLRAERVDASRGASVTVRLAWIGQGPGRVRAWLEVLEPPEARPRRWLGGGPPAILFAGLLDLEAAGG